MKKGLKIFKAELEGVYPVGNCLILVAYDIEEAREIAKEAIVHTSIIAINEMTINEPQIIEYISGDY